MASADFLSFLFFVSFFVFFCLSYFLFCPYCVCLCVVLYSNNNSNSNNNNDVYNCQKTRIVNSTTIVTCTLVDVSNTKQLKLIFIVVI